MIGFLQSAQGAPTTLWMRQETNAATHQMVESVASATSLTLPFTNTTTYDFFSPPLTSSISLTTADRGGGAIYMRNTAPVGAFDFSVTGRMQYFDYDPLTRSHTLIVDTGSSAKKNVNHGQTIGVNLPNVSLPTTRTLAPGHMLHVAVTVTVTDGFPYWFGSFVYNTSTGTKALLPENRVISFPFGALKPISPASMTGWNSADGKYTMTVYGSPGGSYNIQATTNLSNSSWLSLATNNADTNGLLVFKDVDSSNYSARFYRVLSR